MIDAEAKREARLPAAVLDLAHRLGADTQTGSGEVRLRQSGRMKTQLDAQSWMPFTAKQTISIRACTFDWLAHAGPLA